MRYSTSELLTVVPAVVYVLFIIAVFVGLGTAQPALSVLAIWTSIATMLYVVFVMKPKWGEFIELDRQMSFWEAIRTRVLWRAFFLKKWLIIFFCMLLGISLPFDLGLPWSGVLGVYLFVFLAALEDCRIRVECPEAAND